MPDLTPDHPSRPSGQNPDNDLNRGTQNSVAEAVLQRAQLIIEHLGEHEAVPLLQELKTVAEQAVQQRGEGTPDPKISQQVGELLRQLRPHTSNKMVEGAAVSLYLVFEGVDEDLSTLVEPRGATRVLKHGVEGPTTMPENRHGLENGSIIFAKFDLKPYGMGVDKGEGCEIAYDGRSVRSGPYDWSLSQILGEIDQGVWEVENPAENC